MTEPLRHWLDAIGVPLRSTPTFTGDGRASIARIADFVLAAAGG